MRLELRIPQPYLNPGRYFLSVSLLSGQTYFDLLFHVAAFDVTPIHVAPATTSSRLPVPARCDSRIGGRTRRRPRRRGGAAAGASRIS